MEINKKNRTELKKYFQANMIPLEGHFAALIDSGFNQAEDGITKIPGSPLSLQAEGEPSGTLDVLHLYQSFEDEAPSWMLNLNPELNPDEPEAKQPGFNITDKNGMSRLFIKEGSGEVGIGTVTPKSMLDVREGSIYAGNTNNISGKDPGIKLLLNHSTESHSTGHVHGAIGWVGPGRDMSTNLSASISAGSSSWDDQGYLSFATSDGPTNPIERIRITETGQIGIGTSTPQARLHLVNDYQDANGNTLILGSKDKSNLRLGYHQEYSWIQSHGLKPLRINELGNDTIFNLKGGRVGIGTNQPRQKLEVRNGTIYSGSTQEIKGEQAEVKLLLNHAATSNDKGHAHGVIGWIGSGRDMSANLSASISAGSSSWDDQGYLSFATSDETANPKERIRITETGNVGIGLSSPSVRLEVAGSVKATQFIGDGSGLTNLSLGETGLNLALATEARVGIGTKNPAYKLDVTAGNAKINNVFIGDVGHGEGWAGFAHSKSIGTQGYALLQDQNGQYTLINKKSGGGYIGFRVDNVDKLVLQDNGNVGIGTTTPSQPLHVVGNALLNQSFVGDVGHGEGWAGFTHSKSIGTESYALLQDQNGQYTLINKKSGGGYIGLRVDNADKVVLLDSGNLGIGTNAPDQKLTIKNGGIGFDHNSADKKLYSPKDGLLEWVTHNAAVEHAFAVSHQGEKTVYLSTHGNSYLNGGNVGIGTTNPEAALSIAAKGKERNPDGSLHITNNCILFGGNNAGKQMDSAQISAGKHAPNSLNIVGMSADKNGNNRKVHLWAEGGMLVNGVVTAHDFRKHSDRRIKKEIKVSDPQSDLATLMQLQVSDYHFIDQDKYDAIPQKKIIAQQVLEVYPTAVSNQTIEVVPDVFKEATVDKGEVSLEDHGLRIGEKVRITLKEVDTDEGEPMNEIYEVLEATIDTFKIASAASGQVFVYGREVDDFCTVDMDALAMLNISATQALHQMVENLTKDCQELTFKYQQLLQQPGEPG